jgi:IclR family pca regulon transcriptional regulator
MPHLERLVERAHESSSVSVLDGDEVVYVARVPTRRIMRIAIAVGTRFPAFATSMGRVLLAGQSDEWLDGYFATAPLRSITPHTIADAKRPRTELIRIRKDGYALVDQELEEGLRSIAVPIRDSNARVVAAVNLSTHTSRGTVAGMRQAMLGPLLETAAAIEEDLRSARG